MLPDLSLLLALLLHLEMLYARGMGGRHYEDVSSPEMVLDTDGGTVLQWSDRAAADRARAAAKRAAAVTSATRAVAGGGDAGGNGGHGGGGGAPFAEPEGASSGGVGGDGEDGDGAGDDNGRPMSPPIEPLSGRRSPGLRQSVRSSFSRQSTSLIEGGRRMASLASAKSASSGRAARRFWQRLLP